MDILRASFASTHEPTQADSLGRMNRRHDQAPVDDVNGMPVAFSSPGQHRIQLRHDRREQAFLRARTPHTQHHLAVRAWDRIVKWGWKAPERAGSTPRRCQNKQKNPPCKAFKSKSSSFSSVSASRQRPSGFWYSDPLEVGSGPRLLSRGSTCGIFRMAGAADRCYLVRGCLK